MGSDISEPEFGGVKRTIEGAAKKSGKTLVVTEERTNRLSLEKQRLVWEANPDPQVSWLRVFYALLIETYRASNSLMIIYILPFFQIPSDVETQSSSQAESSSEKASETSDSETLVSFKKYNCATLVVFS